MIDLVKLQEFLKSEGKNPTLKIASKNKVGVSSKLYQPKGKQVDALQFNCMATFDKPNLLSWFKNNDYSQLEF